MKILILLAVAAAVVPSQQAPNPQYQFHRNLGSNFQSGVNIPATLTHLDSYGLPTIVSHAMSGFGNVQKPMVSAGGPISATSAFAAFPSTSAGQQQSASPQKKFTGRPFLPPLLKVAVDAGFVRQIGSSQPGLVKYDISSSLVEDAGSVSELAYRFGATPVAAVHDVQMPPNAITNEESFSPVLVLHERPERTLYTLEVPFQ